MPGSTTVVATTATSMTTAGGAQIIEWIWSGAHSPMPEGVALSIAAALVPLFHAGYRYLMARFAQPENPTQPAQ